MQNETIQIRLATPAVKPDILNIITTAFATAPAMTWMLQRSKNKNKLAFLDWFGSFLSIARAFMLEK